MNHFTYRFGLNSWWSSKFTDISNYFICTKSKYKLFNESNLLFVYHLKNLFSEHSTSIETSNQHMIRMPTCQILIDVNNDIYTWMAGIFLISFELSLLGSLYSFPTRIWFNGNKWGENHTMKRVSIGMRYGKSFIVQCSCA